MEQENVIICTVPVAGDVLKIAPGPELEFESGPVLELEFESGQVLISDEHEQDCYEQVYADWEQLDAYAQAIKDGGPYTGLTIKGIPEMGILLVFEKALLPVKVFVPCYNKQNGYYSSDLALSVTYSGQGATYDVSDYVDSVYEI